VEFVASLLQAQDDIFTMECAARRALWCNSNYKHLPRAWRHIPLTIETQTEQFNSSSNYRIPNPLDTIGGGTQATRLSRCMALIPIQFMNYTLYAFVGSRVAPQVYVRLRDALITTSSS